MRAMVLDRYGDTPHIVDRPTPAPGAGQLLVRVRATSVNPIDWKQASGKLRLFIPAKFPFVPGYDLAGDIVALGAGVTGFSVGMRVHTRLSGGDGGASAELVLAGVDVARPIPAAMDYAEAAGLPLAGMTALQGLRDVLGVPMSGARERVLVVGASGGVGHLAVQIARAAGAHVVGVCSGRNAALVQELGAHEVVDYTQPDAYAGHAPFDAVLDCVGGSPGAFTPRLTATGRFGSCVPGPSVFAWPLWHPFTAQRIRPVMLKPNAADLAVLGTLVHAGALRVVIDQRFPLEDLAGAWARSQTGRAVGKIVLSA